MFLTDMSLLADKATNCVQMSGGDSMLARKIRVEVFDDDAHGTGPCSS